ncbi:hypothetical protein GGI23_002750, partial [Coemansia sp. RSA 2559]
MFTSPSVRVKRRQTALRTPTATSQTEAVRKEYGLKRLAQPTEESSFAGAKQKHPPVSDAFQTAQFHPSPRKKQASDTNHLVWQPHINGMQEGTGLGFVPRVPEDELHQYSTSDAATNGSAKLAMSAAGSRSSIFTSCALGGPPSNNTEEETTAGEHGRTLLRGDKHAVLEVSCFPETVRKLLGSIDLRNVPLTSGLSSESGFAFVATPTTCLVWSYSRSAASMDSVYKLAMPDPQSAAIYEAPVVALVSAGERQSDVGLLSCSPTGEVRYWDRVVFGLGGTDRFYAKDLELVDAED